MWKKSEKYWQNHVCTKYESHTLCGPCTSEMNSVPLSVEPLDNDCCVFMGVNVLFEMVCRVAQFRWTHRLSIYAAFCHWLIGELDIHYHYTSGQFPPYFSWQAAEFFHPQENLLMVLLLCWCPLFMPCTSLIWTSESTTMGIVNKLTCSWIFLMTYGL